MKKNVVQLSMLTLFMYLFTSPAFADEYTNTYTDRVLNFDQPHLLDEPLNFKNDDKLKPVANDFRIVKASYMSNRAGERWAVITFENQSSGQRLLKNEVIVATFADGFKSNAHNLNEILKGNERRTISVFFGNNQFPIIAVQVE